MKRITLIFSILLSVAASTFSQEEIVVKKRLPGQLYVEPVGGYTYTGYSSTYHVGGEFGYRFDVGPTIALSAIYRPDMLQASLNFGHQFRYLKRSYPYVSLGAGILTGVPFDSRNMVFPLLDYRAGYSVILVEDKLDLGIGYRGECLFVLGNSSVGTWFFHNAEVSLKWYISSPYNTKHW